MTTAKCNELCLDSGDVGVPGYGIAYAHPMCPKHGEPHEFKWNGKVHDTHSGLLRWCECGAYEDEHRDDPKTVPEKLDAAQTGVEFAQVLGGLFASLERARDTECEASDE